MATYLQGFNPNTYQLTPYETPIKEIANAISQRSQFWLEGAMQVKSAYEQAAQLDLSRSDNKKILNDFMVEAEDKLKKAARTDLSISDNVKAATSIFKPLYQDEALMADDQLTTFYKSQEQAAQQAKMRDGGKEFSNLNLNYMREKYQDYINDPSRDNWQGHYQSRRGYTPYYDYSKEFENITKNCKPNSTTTQSPTDSLYFNFEQNVGVPQAKLSSCLQSGLSERARQQMGIEGYMKYGKDYNALASDYLSYVDRDLNPRIEERKAIDGALQGLMDKQKSGKKLTDAEVQEMDLLQNQKGTLDDYINEQIKTRDKVVSGDSSFIEQNYETLSSSLYTHQKVGQYSTAFQYQNATKKIVENNAAIAQLRMHHDVGMQAMEFEQKKELEEIRFQNDVVLESMKGVGDGSKTGQSTRVQMVNGVPTVVPNYADLDPASTNEDLISSSEKEVNQTLEAATAAKRNADQWLFEEIGDKFPQYKTPQELLQSTDFANYVKKNPDADALNYWRNQVNSASGDIIRMSSIKKGVENSLRQTNPELFSDQEISDLAPVYISGQPITAKQVKDAINGLGDGSVIITNVNNAGFVGGGSGSGFGVSTYGGGSTTARIIANGVDVSNVPEVKQLFKRVKDANKDISSKVERKKAELFAQERILMEGFKDISVDNNDKNVLRQRIASAAGIKPDQVTLRYSDLSGKVFFGITGDDKNPVPENLLSALSSSFKTVEQERGLFSIDNAPEYSFFPKNNTYKEQYITANHFEKLKEADINSGKVVEMPIQTSQDLQLGNGLSSSKLIIKKGSQPGSKLYYIATKVGDEYKQLPKIFNSSVEAMRYAEEVEKYRNAR